MKSSEKDINYIELVKFLRGFKNNLEKDPTLVITSSNGVSKSVKANYYKECLNY